MGAWGGSPVSYCSDPEAAGIPLAAGRLAVLSFAVPPARRWEAQTAASLLPPPLPLALRKIPAQPGSRRTPHRRMEVPEEGSALLGYGTSLVLRGGCRGLGRGLCASPAWPRTRHPAAFCCVSISSQPRALAQPFLTGTAAPSASLAWGVREKSISEG